MQLKLGIVSSQQHWRFTEYHKSLKPRFGSQKGIFRVFVYIGELLDLCEDRQWEKVPGALAVLAPAILQVGLDEGRWHTAALMAPFEDPLEHLVFGGEPQLLENIYQYRRALLELRTRMGNLTPAEGAAALAAAAAQQGAQPAGT